MRALFVPSLKEAENIFGDIKPEPYKYGIIRGTYKNVPLFITSVSKTGAAFSASVILRDENITEAWLTGICGGYRQSGIRVGDVVCVNEDWFADEAVFYADKIETLNDLGFGLTEKGCVSYSVIDDMPIVKSNTVSYLDGVGSVSEMLFKKTGASVENMEGASFGYVCNQLSVKAFQIRSVSNYCGVRSEQEWNIRLAFANLKSFFEYRFKSLI